MAAAKWRDDSITSRGTSARERAASSIARSPAAGLSLILLGAYVLQGWRMYRRYLSSGLSPSDAALVTRFVLLGKFAEVIGIVRYCISRVRGRFHIIEYR